jgi:tRNA nucleotidyltransferase (CCA-adding enzyme)
MVMKIDLPFWINYILHKLMSNGYEAYVVGGCVRDSFLGRKPKDWDIATNATPEQVKQVCVGKLHSIDTGIKHGTITLMANYLMDESGVYTAEVTTYRIDGKYSDNRRPDTILYTNSLKEDLSRRDFTINALAYNHKDGLIDYFNGIEDLNKGIIRCVGNPNERFTEDALRMLRAIRFSAQLGFLMAVQTSVAVKRNAKLIEQISKERITDEINKILWSSNPEKINALYGLGLLNFILPELSNCFDCKQNNPYHCYNVFEHIVKSVKAMENNLVLRLTMLFHDIAKPLCKSIDEDGRDHFYEHGVVGSKMASEILKRMRYDNYTIMRVRDLVLYHDAEIADTRKSVRSWLNKVGEETFRDLLKVREADIKAQNPEYYQKRHDKLERIKVILEGVLNDKECFSKKDLAINGSDLMNMGYPEGKQIGELINKLVDAVLDNPSINTREQLMALVKQFV